MRVIIALDRVTRGSLADRTRASVNLRVDGTVLICAFTHVILAFVYMCYPPKLHLSGCQSHSTGYPQV